MKAIIPAAGIGSRLQPLTNDLPKCLVQVNGKPLLYYILNQLKEANIDEVIIVTGYKNELIENFLKEEHNFPPTICIFNPDYFNTNSILSLYLTREYWNSDFIIIDSDLILNSNLVKSIINSTQTALLIDNSKNYEMIDMKVSVKNSFVDYLDKQLSPTDTHGEFFGVSKWKKNDAAELLKIMNSLIIENQTNIWYEFAIRKLAQLINISVINCSSSDWIEIDTYDDYCNAQKFIVT